jgi:hypothetical protein
MKSINWKLLFSVAVVVLLTAMLSGPARADYEWFFTHGHSGHVQDLSVVTTAPFGDGLDVTLTTGLFTWVHFAIPSKTLSSTAGVVKQSKVRYLRLKFGTANGDIRLLKVHVWDGNSRFVVIEKDWASGWYGNQDVLIDLGKAWNIYRGLGVSLEIDRGVESVDHTVTFRSVGARWQY